VEDSNICNNHELRIFVSLNLPDFGALFYHREGTVDKVFREIDSTLLLQISHILHSSPAFTQRLNIRKQVEGEARVIEVPISSSD